MKKVLCALAAVVAMVGCGGKGGDKGQVAEADIQPPAVVVEEEAATEGQKRHASEDVEESKPFEGNCEWSGKEIGNKRFATESDWKGITCKEEEGDASETQQCVFPNANLRQVYDIAKQLHPYLIAQIPAKDIEFTCQDSELSGTRMAYKYKRPMTHLIVEVEHLDGYPKNTERRGYDRIEIAEDENVTRTIIIFRD